MKKFLFIISIITLTSKYSIGQNAGDYRSATTGNWDVLETWQVYNGLTWVDAIALPNIESGTITIQSAHIVTISSISPNCNQIIINPGGRLIINAGQTLTLEDGVGTDLTVYGILDNSGELTVNPNATITFGSGSTYQHNKNGGVIPAAVWDINSTCEIKGVTSTIPTGFNQNFGNLNWDCPNQTNEDFLIDSDISVNGNFTLSNGVFVLTDGSLARILSISGDYIQNGGRFDFYSGGPNSSKIYLSGNLIHTTGSGTMYGTGSAKNAEVVFNGTSTQTISFNTPTGSSWVRYIINAGSKVQMLSNLTLYGNNVIDDYGEIIINGTIDVGTKTINHGGQVSGGTRFTLNSGATIITAHSNGINGSIPSSNTTKTFSSGANYIYNGTSVQITGTRLPNNITGDLSIDNPSGVTLSSAITISTGSLTLINGNLNSTSANLITLGASAIINGGQSSSFVNGPIAITGTGNKFFPIGKGTTFRPVLLQDITGTATIIRAEVFNSGSGGIVGTGLSKISSLRYWQITETGGIFTSAQVNLTYGVDDSVNDNTYLRIANSSSLNGTYNNAGGTGSANGSGNIISNSLSALGYFTLANASGGTNLLPVELSSFSASIINAKVKLIWQTATEVNNYGFEVERKVGSLQSTVGNFEKIGFVNGNGNSSSPKSYSFVDDKVIEEKYSYRLKQIDNDGEFEYSKSIEVDLGSPKKYELSQNYPNPFNPTTTIQFQLPQAGMVKLTLYNILGQEIKTLLDEMKEAGTHSINFNASDLNSGMYIYKIESGSFIQTRKMTLLK